MAARLRTRVVRRLHEVSLSARLVAIVTSLLVVALVLTGVVTVALLQRVLASQVDDDLTSLVRNEEVLKAVVNTPSNSSTVLDLPPSDYIVQVNDAAGNVIPRPTPPNQDDSSFIKPVPMDQARRLSRQIYTVDGPEGERLRAVAVQGETERGVPVVAVVARSLEPAQRAVSKVAAWFFVVGLVVAFAGALLGAAAVRRAFRPLRGVEAVASAYGGGDTTPRVGSAPATTEVGRLGLAVNAMLDRIETSLAEREASEERMRRFVADASHELRTPLAAVRGFAELHRMGALRTETDVTSAFSRVEHEAARMGVLVEDLLLLARLDEQRPMRHDPVDLLSLAVDARTDARALAPDRHVTVVGAVQGGPPTPAVVRGDEARLRQVLANLLANALRHTPAGSPVEIGAGEREGFAVLRVVDHGPGIDPADAKRVFERFYRADPSRARHQGGGSGLGLAIVAAIVAAHGGAVRLVATPGGGATAEVALPLVGHDGPEAGFDEMDEMDGPDEIGDAGADDGGADGRTRAGAGTRIDVSEDPTAGDGAGRADDGGERHAWPVRVRALARARTRPGSR